MSTLLAPRPPVLFAHDSEAEIARLLDFYGVHWQYEPRSFVLGRSDDGQTTKAFTPDFYLPDYDLFLEVTTVRPSLISRKNRKLRHFREQYPDINIKLLTLRDVEALFLKYGGRREVEIPEAQKSLSNRDTFTDLDIAPSHSKRTSSVPTNLATHQDNSKRARK